MEASIATETMATTEQSLTFVQRICRALQFMRVVSVITLIVFVNAVLYPGIAVAKNAWDQHQESLKIHLTGTPAQQFSQALLTIQQISQEKHQRLTERLTEESGALDTLLSWVGLSQLQLEDLNKLQQLDTMLGDLHSQALADFQYTEQTLQARTLPQEILRRHQAAVDQYQQQYQAMMTQLRTTLEAGDLKAQGDAMDALNKFMATQKFKKTHESVDPNNLPWSTPKAENTRKPATNAAQLSQLTGISRYSQGTLLAANVITPDMLGQPGGPVAEDLAYTIDTPLTDAIKAQAEALDHDPVKIYNWVRNNIEFIPSYGSIQGADYTLQHGRGNAFDTASLLIALLRAADIPARYAYGTVSIPAQKVMNWVGGVDVPEVAQQLLGQGGIPNVGIAQGGKITDIRMEHIWVEAWVDYFPSRGAKHITGDQWIPMDASFKQYDYTAGEDLQNQVPFDAQGLINQVKQNSTFNDDEGWVQGVDQQQVETALNDYQQQIENYINNQNPDATVGDILGSHKVIIQEHQQLAAGLPYKLEARTHNYSTLPDNLRHKFRYTLGTSASDNNRLITFEKPLPELAGHALSVSFKPSTADDEAVIASYLPEADPETGEIDPAQLPDTLPGYLINLTAEFSDNNEVVETAAAGKMGRELYETLALWSPSQGWDQAVNHPTAGEYRAIGLDLQGANAKEAAQLQAQIEASKTILENGNASELATLTKNELVGNLLYATIYSYLALNDVQDQLQSRAAGIINYRLPSFGVFSTRLQTSYLYGYIPRDVRFGGLAMDVDHLATQNHSKDNDWSKTLAFRKGSGARASAMEHLVPEQMFSTPETPAQGISAIKALSLANAAGQKIWTIDQHNLNTALAAIDVGSDIENEIANAVNAGKIATVHEKPIAFGNGTNVGYLLIDPETGAGAYKIASGDNGGFLYFLTGVIFGLFIGLFINLFIAAFVAVTLLAGVIIAGVLAILVSSVVALLSNMNSNQKACFLGGFFIGIDAIGILSSNLVLTALGISGNIFIPTNTPFQCYDN